MYWQRPRHPRAGIAIGSAILVAWLGAIGVSFATDGSSDGNAVPAKPGAVRSGP